MGCRGVSRRKVALNGPERPGKILNQPLTYDTKGQFDKGEVAGRSKNRSSLPAAADMGLTRRPGCCGSSAIRGRLPGFLSKVPFNILKKLPTNNHEKFFIFCFYEMKSTLD